MTSSSALTLLSLRGFLHFADVGLKEEMAEEHKVAEVHERGPEDVLKVGVALVVVMLHPVEDQEYRSTVMWWYQCRKISFCFLRMMNIVSPSSGALLSTNA